jgi:hypothetical protein
MTTSKQIAEILTKNSARNMFGMCKMHPQIVETKLSERDGDLLIQNMLINGARFETLISTRMVVE